MDAQKFLTALQDNGLLAPNIAERLTREALIAGKSVDELIYERRLADAEKVAEVKSALTGVPYQKIEPERFDESLKSLIPQETVQMYKVAPISRSEGALVVGMVDPDDIKAQEALKFVARRLGMDLGVYLISVAGWQGIVRKYSPYRSELEAAVRGLGFTATAGTKKVVELEKGGEGSVDAPVIRIVAETLREAVEAQASDIHIEPEKDYLRVRFRVDGKLKEAASLPLEVAQAVVSRVKVMSNLKIDESRIPQDGRFRSKIFEREIDFRVSTFPTPLGEKAAIRVLDPTTGLKTLEQLGLSEKNYTVLKKGLERPFGMILITGPTGSGKTTTLYAILQILNHDDVNIVSLEDPVEYFVPGVNQSQVQPEIGYDFASGLRQILRQDPDVILVGEIRDKETAGLAVHAALTGHVMLSTLHTNNALGTIPRLIDMDVEPFLIPSTLSIVIGQRLVSQLCTKCKAPETAAPALQNEIREALADLPGEATVKFKAPYQIYRAKGCEACHGLGTIGRIALFEIFMMTPEIAAVVTENPSAQKIAVEIKKQGMATMRQDGVLKALEGVVPIEEVMRETEDA